MARSQYGVYIKKYVAGILYEGLNGCRRLNGDNHEYNRAMMSNSLFLYYLESIGLKTSKDGSTRDIISIDFSMGANDYEHSRKRVELILKGEKNTEKRNNLKGILEFMDNNKDNFKKVSKEKIREQWYRDGLDITYTTKKADKVEKDTVHYKYLYRSVGQAKVGSAIFIREELFEQARDFMYMGVKLPSENAKVVEMGAYSSLVASSVIGTLTINPENVLILDDTESFLKTNVISVEVDDNNHCVAIAKDDYELKNVINDGMALLDKSVFPTWGNGYVLLRNHMTKCAAFKTDIQKFFQDEFGNEYESAIVYDKWGNKHFAKDIKMIVTTESTKWLKFNVSYEEFCQIVHDMGDKWGVVKTAHKSKHIDGTVQRMSYQMVNCLDIDTLGNVTDFSEKYIWQLKTDDDVFMKFLKDTSNYANDHLVMLALIKHCGNEFKTSTYFQKRRNKIISAFSDKVKSGKLYIEGADNLVMCGNPYVLLLKAVGRDYRDDKCFEPRDDCVECYTPRFKDGEYLAGFRSPHNGLNNILALKNKHNEIFDKYFDLTNQCIAVNCIGTDIQDRGNGLDFDSDMIFCTNHKDIVNRALYAYKHYPTIVNNIPMETSNYGNTYKDYVKTDIAIAKGNRSIGESSNLAQLALSYSYVLDDPKYQDFVCILSVIAQAIIDGSKRRVSIDLVKETKYIKEQLEVKRIGVPVFWRRIKKNINPETINFEIDCPMNRLHELKLREIGNHITHPINDLFVEHDLKNVKRKSKKVEKLIADYSSELFMGRIDKGNIDPLTLREDFDKLVEKIRTTYISKDYAGVIYWILKRTFNEDEQVELSQEQKQINKNRALMLKVLYQTSPKSFLSCFKKAENA